MKNNALAITSKSDYKTKERERAVKFFKSLMAFSAETAGADLGWTSASSTAIISAATAAPALVSTSRLYEAGTMLLDFIKGGGGYTKTWPFTSVSIFQEAQSVPSCCWEWDASREESWLIVSGNTGAAGGGELGFSLRVPNPFIKLY